MCRDEKNHELVGQEIHREARALVLGRWKISPLFLHSCTHCLFTFRWTNYVISDLWEIGLLTVRVSKRPASFLHRAGGQRKKGLSQTLHEDAVAAGVELHSLNAALIFCNTRAQQRTHLFICIFMMCSGMALFCSFFFSALFLGGVEGGAGLYNTCIYIICILQK